MSNPATIYAAVGANPATLNASAGQSPAQGPREIIPFAFIDIAAGDNATPASSTPVEGNFCGVATIPTGVTMLRPGSLTGLSVHLSGAAAGSAAIVGVYKSGTIFNVLTVVTFSIGNTDKYITFPAGTYTFIPGDVVDVRIRTGSGWSATTVDATVLVEIETTT